MYKLTTAKYPIAVSLELEKLSSINEQPVITALVNDGYEIAQIIPIENGGDHFALILFQHPNKRDHKPNNTVGYALLISLWIGIALKYFAVI